MVVLYLGIINAVSEQTAGIWSKVVYLFWANELCELHAPCGSLNPRPHIQVNSSATTNVQTQPGIWQLCHDFLSLPCFFISWHSLQGKLILWSVLVDNWKNISEMCFKKFSLWENLPSAYPFLTIVASKNGCLKWLRKMSN